MSPGTGADRIVEALRLDGMRIIFGLPGTQTLPLFEALRRSDLRFVLATSELSAALMAGGWARVTGRPGVVTTIPGPGFTWALTGIAEARLDSIPLVHLAGSPPAAVSGRRFGQQELAQAAIAGPLVKAVFNADDGADPGKVVAEALRLAASGEPGPVMVHASFATLASEGVKDTSVTSPISKPAPDLSILLARLSQARRPVVLAGQGTLGHADLMRQLAERLGAPVVTTPSGRGALAEDHPLAIGFDPLAGGLSEVNALFGEADLVLVLGAKLGHNGSAAFGLRLPPDRLVHVDASAEVIGANYPVSLGLVGDVGAVLAALLGKLDTRATWPPALVAERRASIRQQVKDPLEPRIAGTASQDSAGFFGALRRALPREAILVLDSGLHQILARRYYPVWSARGLLFPSDLQSMGFAIPTAIGARLGAPDRPVVALVGDGGFSMSALELLSAARERLALTVIVFVDGQLGQIRLQQLSSYGATYAVNVHNPDFASLAEAVGARFTLVDEDFEAVLAAALAHDGVSILAVPVGDTLALTRMAATARTREIVRAWAGPGVIGWIKRLLRRGG